ncbi:peritrophin-55 [Drosophila virilis]|uniref:peritrophin-55 n=1 Tax=Drosophila virilis TaxID=7244 RepID=UPI00017D5A9A|nr:peritrophin-55 [Drosophila virilis]
MRAVLIAVTGLLAISVRAQESCVTPEYTTDIVPVCQANLRIKLPSYADPTSYYSCTTGKPILTQCKAPTGYFSYVLQECTSCANYLPAVACEEIKLNLKCEPISESGVTTAAPPGNSTAAPTTVTTAAPPGDSTSAAPTTVTTKDPTTAAPTTVTTGASTTVDGNEPSGTTISIPNPPSPNDPNVPAPPTPAPTAGTIVPGPPTVGV